ncbi:MAG TPA: hypothetical protein VHV08_05100 [Pirellulales bacterium]|nr:hypothetical protein [Pirellulales bacterium]
MAIYDRDELRKRLSQIAVALGHPRLTAKQSIALRSERRNLEAALLEAKPEAESRTG